MKIIIIGSGNIATHIANAFHRQGHIITQIFSKHSANAYALAELVHATAISNLTDLDTEADIYLIAVSDSAITAVVADMPIITNGIVVHTSGATSMNVLDRFEKHGVIYPAQSMNKHINTDINTVPFGLEANSTDTAEKLHALLTSISSNVFACDSEQRLALHLAAVLVNNFPNALYSIANTILQRANLSFDLLRPIILETAKKVQNHLPTETQTGPAARNDSNTINKHLQFLSYSNELTQIYQHLSDFIIKSRDK